MREQCVPGLKLNRAGLGTRLQIKKQLSTKANQTNGGNKEIHYLAEFELHQKFETHSKRKKRQKIKKSATGPQCKPKRSKHEMVT